MIIAFSSSRNPLTKWSRGRLILLGDAAHPMLQYAGQGAAQALEDAFTLVSAYRKHGPTKMETVFREYEQVRIPRSTKVMQFAREIGYFAHQEGEGKLNRDILLRQHGINDFDILDWLYAEQKDQNQ